MTVTANETTLRVQGREISVDPEHFGELRDSSDAINDPAELNRRMESDGYLLMRGLLPREDVLEARREVTSRLAARGLLDPDRPVEGAYGLPPEQAEELHVSSAMNAGRYKVRLEFMPDDLAKDNAALDHILYGETMMSFFERFFDEPVKHYDFTWFRSIFPNSKGTRAHTDVIFMGRAERERLFTAWTPIGDIDYQQGGLMILEGSHKHTGLREGYSSTDVDEHCVNHPGRPDWWERNHMSKGDDVAIGSDADAVRELIGGRWLTSEFQAGDVLIFSVFTVHGSLDNQSDRIRLSSDSRYQPASKPADERWVGKNPPGHGPDGKRGLIC